MEILVRLGDGKVVEASFDGHTVQTDQPVKDGGGGTAPSPFDFFLASIATCAGYYVLDFCRSREIPTGEIDLSMSITRDEQTHMIDVAHIEIGLPASFPSRYEKAVVRAAQLCSVKKHIDQGLSVELHTRRHGVATGSSNSCRPR